MEWKVSKWIRVDFSLIVYLLFVLTLLIKYGWNCFVICANKALWLRTNHMNKRSHYIFLSEWSSNCLSRFFPHHLKTSLQIPSIVQLFVPFLSPFLDIMSSPSLLLSYHGISTLFYPTRMISCIQRPEVFRRRDQIRHLVLLLHSRSWRAKWRVSRAVRHRLKAVRSPIWRDCATNPWSLQFVLFVVETDVHSIFCAKNTD